MIIYTYVQELKAAGIWEVLLNQSIVNPQVLRQIEIYEKICEYISLGNNVSESVLWAADDFYISESWAWALLKRYSTKIPEALPEVA